MVKGFDVRDAGSGHATATNTFRQAGLFPGLLVLALDLAKGFVPTFLAIRYGQLIWIAPLTAGLAVVGHCWPIFAGFHGGMGLATGGGAVLAVSPLAFVICFGVLVALTLMLRHSARASVISSLLFPLVLWLFRMQIQPIAVAGAVGIVIAVRFLRDWHREYSELWLDRGKD